MLKKHQLSKILGVFLLITCITSYFYFFKKEPTASAQTEASSSSSPAPTDTPSATCPGHPELSDIELYDQNVKVIDYEFNSNWQTIDFEQSNPVRDGFVVFLKFHMDEDQEYTYDFSRTSTGSWTFLDSEGQPYNGTRTMNKVISKGDYYLKLTNLECNPDELKVRVMEPPPVVSAKVITLDGAEKGDRSEFGYGKYSVGPIPVKIKLDIPGLISLEKHPTKDNTYFVTYLQQLSIDSEVRTITSQIKLYSNVFPTSAKTSLESATFFPNFATDKGWPISAERDGDTVSLINMEKPNMPTSYFPVGYQYILSLVNEGGSPVYSFPFTTYYQQVFSDQFSCRADINSDRIVDLTDYSILISKFMERNFSCPNSRL